jgi:NAD(P)H-flavin reductase
MNKTMIDNSSILNKNAYLQHEAEIIEHVQESESIFTWRLKFTDPQQRETYHFAPGQFNMVYAFGFGEVAISIVPDIKGEGFVHTIQAVGHVTKSMAKLGIGDRIGIRGPFGRGWPLEDAKNKDVILLSGGLGCAPTVCAIEHILKHRSNYGRLIIMQGIRYQSDYIYQSLYKTWSQAFQTEVMISASREKSETWPLLRGRITEHIEGLSILNPSNTVIMMCGPEGLMQNAAERFIKRGVSEKAIYLGIERNMHCGVGHCGHCQCGPVFVCKDGPIFPYDKIKSLLAIKGL